MIAKIKNFFGEVKAEMIKVTWSSRGELIQSTSIVLVVIGFLAFFLGVVDFMFARIMQVILK